MKGSTVSKATLGRLPRYLELLKGSCAEYVSATVVAKALGLGEVQVRKDLGAVCGRGRPKVGYLTSDLIESIEACIGRHATKKAVLVGAGKLGQALMDYRGFEDFGVSVVAAFDNNDEVVSSHQRVLAMSELEAVCKEHNVQIGIITVGAISAQGICDLLVSLGIRAIWNFAPCELKVPSDVIFVQEDLALSLAHLKNKIK